MAYYIFIFAASFVLLSFTLAVHINEKINQKNRELYRELERFLIRDIIQTCDL